MPAGYSLHFGLNHVDPRSYAGWDGWLRGCINDAQAMHAVCQQCGYASSEVYLDDRANSETILGTINNAAHVLVPGDILVVTYSGHGGLIPDPWGVYGSVPTLCTWDRQVISHELGMLWNSFRPGVRVLFLADSCHSGTVTRERLGESVPPPMEELPTPELPNLTLSKSDGASSVRMEPPTEEMLPRAIPPDVQAQVLEQNKFLYRAIFKGIDRPRSACPVLLLSGCQDNQTSCDGARNGLFTERLLMVWNNGAYMGNYRDFHAQIVRMMPPYQTPAYFWQGPPDPGFESMKPFVV